MQKHWQKMATVTNIIGIKIIKSFPQEVISGIDSVEIATIKTHTHTKKCTNIFPGKEICCSENVEVVPSFGFCSEQ